MKTKYMIVASFLALAGAAQAQEIDDMYFNARDRVAHTEATQATMAVRYAAEDQQATKTNPVNPSDSYTGRGVNPEYSAQQKNGAEIIQGNPDYFLTSYKPKGINSNQYDTQAMSYNNCACNGSSGFGNPYSSFYSPYGYSPYGMGYGMGMSPFGYSSGWNVSLMYGMGSMGYGMGYGMPGMYNPYGMYSPYGMYAPYGGYRPYAVSPAYGYDPIQTTYGRRSVRSTAAPSYAYTNSAGAASTSGRTRVAGQSRTDYYDPKWRNDPGNFPTRSYGYGGRSSSFDPSSTGRSSMAPSSGSRSRASYDPFGGGGTRSSGFSSGGSSAGGSGGGRSRGRN